MKILIVGGYGTIGRTVTSSLKEDHEIVVAGRTEGDFTVDIANSESIAALFKALGKVDALISVAGEAKWAKFSELTEEDFYTGIKSKLMGQVNLVRIGLDYLNPKGSITLTTGILADDPVINTTSAAMVNGAIHSFVKAVALEVDNGKRINVVSAGVVEDAYERYKDYFPGHLPIPMRNVAMAYQRSLLGRDHGKIIRVY